MMHFRVYIVDDEPDVRAALLNLLEDDYTVEAFGSAAEFLARVGKEDYGCVLLDVAMPDVDGMALQRQLGAARDRLCIVFLTGHGDIAMGVEAIKAGAEDFLTKPVRSEVLFKAVDAALERSQAHFAKERSSAGVKARLESLTPRERQVLSRVVEGELNKRIAADLGISEWTVKLHRRRIMDKLAVDSVAQLVRTVQSAPPGAGQERPR